MEINQLNDNEITRRLDEAFSLIDNQRSDGLKKLKSIRLVKNKILIKERSRLEQKYGPSHPRLKAMSDRIESNEEILKHLEVEIEKSKITLPDFDQNTWIVHGQVLNKDKTPVSDVTVSLHNRDKKWIKQLGYTCTDQHGYYVLRYRLEEGQAPSVDENEDLFLIVSGSNHELLHCESNPIHISLGRIDSLKIVLTNATCIPPELGDDRVTLD